jgi:hypothetical protein
MNRLLVVDQMQASKPRSLSKEFAMKQKQPRRFNFWPLPDREWRKNAIWGWSKI